MSHSDNLDKEALEAAALASWNARRARNGLPTMDKWSVATGNQSRAHIEEETSAAIHAYLQSASKPQAAGGENLFDYFNWHNIKREAHVRHEQTMLSTALAITPEMRTLEYWFAWCAHANLAAVFTDGLLSSAGVPDGYVLVPKRLPEKLLDEALNAEPFEMDSDITAYYENLWEFFLERLAASQHPSTSSIRERTLEEAGFPTLREANIARQKEWDGDNKITLAYRGNELAGEVGEACNLIKKLERERLGIRGSRASTEQLAEELADVVICADLIAMSENIDLDDAVARKFNATSEKVGLKTRYIRALIHSPSDGIGTKTETESSTLTTGDRSAENDAKEKVK